MAFDLNTDVVFGYNLKSILVVTAAGVATSYVISCVKPWQTVRDNLRYKLTKLAWRSAEKPLIDSQHFRSTFETTQLNNKKPVVGHTHPKSAAARSTASGFIDNYCMLMGMSPYYVQQSRSDQHKGREGSRLHYWTKDYNAQPVKYEPKQNSLLGLVDVDYYVNMPRLLAREFKPTILYSFQPDQVASSKGEYSFTFDKDNHVDYIVAGGGHYNHPLWHYNSDSINVVQKWFGIPVVFANYLVDRKYVNPHHYLLMLTPLARWRGLWAMISYLVSGPVLKRLEIVEQVQCVDEDTKKKTNYHFLRMKVQKSDGLYISTGIAGMNTCVTIPSDDDNELALKGLQGKGALTAGTTKSYLSDKAKYGAVLAYHKATNIRDCPVAFPVEKSVHRYQITENFDEDAKPSMTPIMAPIIHGAFAPDICKENEKACIEGRIEKVRSKPVVETQFMMDCIQEFTKLLIPEPHQLHPVSVEEVYEHQPRPSQRSILNRACNSFREMVRMAMFMKREAYQDIKDPRPITTISGQLKLEYSSYLYAFAEILKEQDWYAFSKKPIEIADRVVEVCENAKWIVNSDFSRFDGRVVEFLRKLERACLLRAFDPVYHSLILDLHSEQLNNQITGKFGSKYDLGFARASGSPETSAFNTLANAFVTYTTFRRMKYNDSFKKFYTPKDSWDRLGVYGGDDGLTANIDPVVYEETASMMGQVLVADKVMKEEGMGVVFLSRVYGPEVWYGDNHSCCDLPRHLSKLHVTVTLPDNITAVDRLLEKCRAYYLTDRYTPILGDFISKVIDLHGSMPEIRTELKPMQAWNSDLELKYQYPNGVYDNYTNKTYTPEWMITYARDSLSKLYFNFEVFNLNMTHITHLREMMNFPCCANPINEDLPLVRSTVFLNDDMLYEVQQTEPVALSNLKDETIKTDVKKPGVSRPSEPNKERKSVKTKSILRSGSKEDLKKSKKKKDHSVFIGREDKLEEVIKLRDLCKEDMDKNPTKANVNRYNEYARRVLSMEYKRANKALKNVTKHHINN